MQSHTESDTLTLGIGISHKGQLKFSESVRQKGNINLADKTKKCMCT